MADNAEAAVGEPQAEPSPSAEEQKPENAPQDGGGDGTGQGEADGEAKAEAPKLRMDFVFDDEKKKKKGKKAKPKPVPRPSRQEYEATLTDLNNILAQLRKRAVKLDEVNLVHNKKLVEAHEMDHEVSQHLSRVKTKHEQTLIFEEEYNLEIIKKRKEYETESQARINVLQNRLNQTEKQLLGEIDMLSYKLRALCIFSDGGDVMLEKMSNIENEYKQSEKTFQNRLFATQQKSVVIRNNTDEEGKARFQRIIDDFTRSREVRNAAYTRRLLSENSDLRRKYNRLIPINLKKEKELIRLEEKTCIVKETHTVINDITKRLENTQIKRIELLEKLKKSYNFYKLQIVTGSKYRRMFEAVKEHELMESSKYQSKQVLLEDIAECTSILHEKYRALKDAENDYLFQRQQFDKFVDAVKYATFSLCSLGEYSYLFPQTFDEYVAKRSGIVSGLIDIITNAERPPNSTAMLKAKYYKGYLGLMSLDYVYCRILQENCCEKPDDLRWIPSYCQRAMNYIMNVENQEKIKDSEPSDPALLCVKK